MRRRLAAVVLIVLALAAPAQASEQAPTLEELESEVMCPTCNSLLSLSDAPVADQIRELISTRIAAGDTKSEIKDLLVAEFGEGVLAAPSKEGLNLLAWVLPFVGLAVAGATVVLLARRSRGASPAVEGPALDHDAEQRVDTALARFED